MNSVEDRSGVKWILMHLLHDNLTFRNPKATKCYSRGVKWLIVEDSWTLTQTSVTFEANVDYGQWYQIINTVRLLNRNQPSEIYNGSSWYR